MKKIAAVCLMGIACNTAYAAFGAIPRLPATVSPERQSPLPGVPEEAVKPAPTIEAPNPNLPPLDESARKVKFFLKKVQLEGNTVYSAEDLAAMYQDLLNKEVNLEELQILASEIEKYYLSNGYVLTRVFIPPQEIDSSGVVKLQIVEGFIDEYVIDGDTKVVLHEIEAYLKPVLASHPLNVATLERAILLINDLAGVEVKAVLTPSVKTQGASTLVVLIARDLFEGSLTADNRGTIYIGPTEFSTTLAMNNIFQHPAQTWLNAKTTSSTSELKSYALNHQANVFENGSTLTGSVTQNYVKPANDLAPLEINGVSTTVTLLYSYPMIRSRRINLNLTADYDYLDSLTDILGQKFTLDKIESLRAGFNFDASDDWQGVNLVTGQLSQGLQLFSGPNQPQIYRTRVDGTKNYTMLDASYTRIQYFYSSPYSLFVSLNGQYAFNPLLSADQIGYGGAQYGSAYDPSEIVADSGFEGKVEARYTSQQTNKLFRGIQYYTSYDWGVLWNRNDEDGLGKQSGTSAAAGVRLVLGPRVNGSLEVAKPLTLKVAAFDNRDARVFFSLSVDLGSLPEVAVAE